MMQSFTHRIPYNVTKVIECSDSKITDTTTSIVACMGIAFLFIFAFISLAIGHVGNRNLICKF